MRFSPRATPQFSKKSHHHRKQKIARVSAALCLIPIDRVNSEGGETDFGSRYKHSK